MRIRLGGSSGSDFTAYNFKLKAKDSSSSKYKGSYINITSNGSPAYLKIHF